MKHRLYTRIISLLVVLSLSLTGLALSVFAVPASDLSGVDDLQPIFIDISASPTYMVVGQTRQVSCTTTPAGLDVAWSSSNTACATVNSSGLVTALREGGTKITAIYTDSSTGTTYSDYLFLYIWDSLGIKDDTKYYIMNLQSGRLLSLELASGAEHTNVNTRNRVTSTLSQWKTEKQADGSFQLINQYTSLGMALSASGTNVDICTDTDASNQKFTIYRLHTGGYDGMYFIRYGEYFVAQDDNNNVYLTTNYTSRVVWCFMAVDKRSADYYSVQVPDTRGSYDDYYNVMTSLGYTSNNWHCISAYDAYWYFQHTNDIFTFVGHGGITGNDQGKAAIRFDDISGNTIGHIAANSLALNELGDYAIGDLPQNALALARCVLYLGCQTGVSYTVDGVSYNLVDETYYKGAHFVLGTMENVSLGDVRTFLDRFLDDCSEKNIEDCLEIALGADPLFSVYYMGDTTQYLGVV